mgnify:CR=1 FL=1
MPLRSGKRFHPVADGAATAQRRARYDGLDHRACAIVADAAALPLADASVDAIVHADVMC